MRIVFFGTPRFAIPSLETLIESPHTVAAVVTQPDRPRGRGRQVSFGPVKELALSRGFEVLQPERLKDPDFLAVLRSVDADLGVVVAYGKLLPAEVLNAPRLGLLNVHASLLPRYRGAAPVHRAIMDDVEMTGVTIMRVVQALDAGPMLAAASRQVAPDETSVEVERALSHLGASLLIETIGRLIEGSVHEVPQNDGLATYAPRVTRDDGVIDWEQPARAIHNRVRGLHPWPHAFSWLEATRVLILRTSVLPSWPEDLTPPAGPGCIAVTGSDHLFVMAGDGHLLSIELLQLEGGRPLTTREFLAGHRLPPASRFVTLPR